MFEFIFESQFWCVGALCVLSSYSDFILRQTQIALKKRQWHVANGSQQPDWGKQLCVSGEHFGFTGLGATLGGGGMSFRGTGATLAFWKVGRTEGGRQVNVGASKSSNISLCTKTTVSQSTKNEDYSKL